MTNKRTPVQRFVMLTAFALAALWTTTAYPHCDTMKGPVVRDARVALDTGNIKPVLKWVGPHQEPELRERFQQTVALRKQGELARQVADRFFFETTVRLHREFENAPFTGLKEDDTHVPAFIKELDKALESGDIDPLLEKILAHTRETIQEGFDETRKLHASADADVQAGRDYVEQYVRFIHHVKAIVDAVHGETHQGQTAESQKCD